MLPHHPLPFHLLPHHDGSPLYVSSQAPVLGDTVTVRSRIDDVYDKKNGALSFVVMESKVTNQRGEHVADVRKSLVHRNG